tara:strand:+ start:1439 stop:2521 length:1083 start_codon:yes stop_codon:yes gene_type:complete
MDFIKLALDQARQAIGLSYPNPAVGAVVIKNSEIIGTGFTQKQGGNHAEIMAIETAKESCENSTLYVTLEPCSHFGKTPPCTERIIQSGIKKVVYGIKDPNPLVCGEGLANLQKANIIIEQTPISSSIKTFYEAYIQFHTLKKPFVSGKFAASLDGKISTLSGESKWITNEYSRAKAHEIRTSSDVVIVGINTILQDDSRLTARKKDGSEYEFQPLRVILDSNGKIPKKAKVFKNPSKTLVAYNNISKDKKRFFENEGINSIQLAKDNRVDVNKLIDYLYSESKYQILVEGGSQILGSFFNLQLIDKIYAFISPIIIGGDKTPSAVGGLGAINMSDIIKLDKIKIESFASDILLTGYPQR